MSPTRPEFTPAFMTNLDLSASVPGLLCCRHRLSGRPSLARPTPGFVRGSPPEFHLICWKDKPGTDIPSRAACAASGPESGGRHVNTHASHATSSFRLEFCVLKRGRTDPPSNRMSGRLDMAPARPPHAAPPDRSPRRIAASPPSSLSIRSVLSLRSAASPSGSRMPHIPKGVMSAAARRTQTRGGGQASRLALRGVMVNRRGVSGILLRQRPPPRHDSTCIRLDSGVALSALWRWSCVPRSWKAQAVIGSSPGSRSWLSDFRRWGETQCLNGSVTMAPPGFGPWFGAPEVRGRALPYELAEPDRRHPDRTLKRPGHSSQQLPEADQA